MDKRAPNREIDAKLHQALHPEQPIEWRPARFSDSDGFWIVYQAGEFWSDLQPCYALYSREDGGMVPDVVPFYSTDHAAAWEAEGALPVELVENYLRELHATAAEPAIIMLPWAWALVRATPLQRAAAMLRTLSVPVGK
jgi:hypothetical protein